MDLFYFQKSDNEKVWLPGFKSKNRLEFTAEAGYFDFIGNDGEAYTVLDVQAINIYDLKGWSSLLFAIFCSALAFPFDYYYGLHAFFIGFIITHSIHAHTDCGVKYFNNSHFNLLR